MNAFDGFRFAEPQWALALWGVLAFVVFLGWRARRGEKSCRE